MPHMNPTRMLTPILAMLVTACASSGTPEPPEPTGLDLPGTYTFTTTVQGMSVNGQMRFTGEPGSYEGSMYSDVTGEVPFSYIETEGTTAVVVAETPDGPVEIRLNFDGDAFAGNWTLGSQGGAIRGRRMER